MSTRSTTHFIDGDEKKPSAIIYRHSDGYPDVAGKDLLAFLRECKKLQDSRLSDANYLAAKYVVFLADQFNYGFERNPETRELEHVRKASRLDFLSVGVMMQDPSDIEYRYVVDCSNIAADGLPTVACYEVNIDSRGKDRKKEKVEIPTEPPVEETPEPLDSRG